MGKFGRKLNENEVRQFGRKLEHASISFGRKAGDAADRLGPVLAVTGMATGDPALTAMGAGIGLGGRALSNLLKPN